MISLRRFVVVAVAVAAVSAGRAARSDEPATGGETMFREGKAAMASGDYATACARFEQSYALEKAGGAILNLAECEERRGRLAAALGRWEEAATVLPAASEHQRFAVDRAKALRTRVPHLVVRLGAGWPAGTVVRVDDRPAVAGVSTAVDPGRHSVQARSPDGRSETTQVALVEGGTKDVSLEAPSPSASPSPPRPPSDAAKPPGGGAGRTAGFVVGAIGIAGFIGFGVTGGMALGAQSTVDAHCNATTRRCDDDGAAAADRGRTLVVIDAVALGVGVVGLGLGTVLVLTSGSSTATTASASLRVGPSGAALTGSF